MNSRKIILIIVLLIALAAGLVFIKYFLKSLAIQSQNSMNRNSSVTGSQFQSSEPESLQETQVQNSKAALSPPIGNWQARVVKKPFGIKVSPTNSPVQPEKFSGYHTGTDFETFPDEADKDVPVFAICGGSLLVKEYASGYGGVAVQECKLNGNDITAIYGHLKLASISANEGQQLAAGSQIGILGKGYSRETDGERKHLHLGIHNGASIDIKGYVQTPAELDQWIDAAKYLK